MITVANLGGGISRLNSLDQFKKRDDPRKSEPPEVSKHIMNNLGLKRPYKVAS
jgi:hypothetical protein